MSGIGTARLALMAALVTTGCAHTCPRGATLRGAPPPRGRAQWCERGAPLMQQIAVPGRTYDSTFGIADPTARGRILDGPITEWYETGELRSHGSFALTPAQRSVPHGVWTYWYQSGQRKSQVRYHMGEPVGCAAEWDEDGTPHTYLAGADGFHPASCPVILDPEATRLPASPPDSGGTETGAVRFSAALGAAYLPRPLPAHSDELGMPEPSIRGGLNLAFRRRLRWLDVGLTGSYLSTERAHDWGAGAALLVSASRPIGWKRVELEAGLELGAHIYSVIPIWSDYVGQSRETFWVPYGGVHGSVGWLATRYLGLYLTLFGQQDGPAKISRRYHFCTFECTDVDATWHVGGTYFGLALELRFLVR